MRLDSASSICCDESTSSLNRQPNHGEISSYTCEADVPKQWQTDPRLVENFEFKIYLTALLPSANFQCHEIDQMDLISRCVGVLFFGCILPFRIFQCLATHTS